MVLLSIAKGRGQPPETVPEIWFYMMLVFAIFFLMASLFTCVCLGRRSQQLDRENAKLFEELRYYRGW
eukprot:gene779-262_t